MAGEGVRAGYVRGGRQGQAETGGTAGCADCDPACDVGGGGNVSGIVVAVVTVVAAAAVVAVVVVVGAVVKSAGDCPAFVFVVAEN